MRRLSVRVFSAGLLLVATALSGRAQLAPDQDILWKRIAGYTISNGLAGPATGPVRAAWYSEGGSRLLVRTDAGRVFESSDLEHWRLNTQELAPASATTFVAAAQPEPDATIQDAGGRLYATGRSNIYASDDNGRTWLNLTGFNNRSILGGGFSGLAVSPVNPREITVTNQFGVWRSADGGLSWRGVNDDLPNLPVRKLLNRRTIVLADSSLAGLEAGNWIPVKGADPEVQLRSQISSAWGIRATAAGQTASLLYIGTAEGRLFASRDNGRSWIEALRPASLAGSPAPIERIWVDPEHPESALATSGGHLLRTLTGGSFWDDVTGTLPQAPIHGIAADRAAGVVYVASDRGVFSGSISLNEAGAPASDWKAISRDLPAAPAWDVRLNSDNTLTVALDGYGVFEAPTPHRARTVRIVNGADMSDRPAAPGSLISVLGANVTVAHTLRGRTAAWPVLAGDSRGSQLQVPFDATPGVLQLTLQGATDSWTAPLTVHDAAPAIFVNSENAPFLLDAASGLVLDPKVPLHAGSLLQILATGLGKVTPDWASGVPAPLESPPVVKGAVTAFLDGVMVPVTHATLAPGYVGYYIVELQLPAIVNRGAAELRLVMNGEESNRVNLYLEPDRTPQ